MNMQRSQTWQWRHQRLDGVRPEIGDIVWSPLTPARRWKVLSCQRDGSSWVYRVDDGAGLNQLWKWTKAKTSAQVDKATSDPSDGQLFDDAGSSDDSVSVKVSGRNDFGGYMFERKCVEPPHPKATVVVVKEGSEVAP